MNSDEIMQNLNVLLDQETTTASENVRPEKDREFNFVLEMSSLTKLGDPGDDDKASNSSYDEITKCKKNQNMTECVPVPSSEHVAEIVGRQGCKIKALRNKTNTYIKTPVRGEEPVFVVTGRKEDVAMARRELQSAAEHFTQIRASRNRHAYLGENLAAPDGGSFTLPVRVPYRVVGLVVGPKGATIKRIQQQTHTYIVTPSRDKEPVFEVTGLPENVEKAKEEIEAHIASRTGTQQTSIDDDFRSNGTEVGSPPMYQKFSQAMAYSQLYNSESALPQNLYNSATQAGTSSYFRAGLPNSSLYSTYNTSRDQPQHPAESLSTHFQPTEGVPAAQHNVMSFPFSQAVGRSASHWNESGIDDTSGSLDHPAVANPQAFGFNAFSTQTFGSERSSVTPNGLSPSSSVGVFPRLSPTLFDKEPFSLGGSHPAARRVASDESSSGSVAKGAAVTLPLNIESGYNSGVTNSAAGSPEEGSTLEQRLAQLALGESTLERCLICNQGAVVAAFVPCGHNLFCYNCADLCVKQDNPVCPFCQKTVTLALRIKNKC